MGVGAEIASIHSVKCREVKMAPLKNEVVSEERVESDKDETGGTWKQIKAPVYT